MGLLKCYIQETFARVSNLADREHSLATKQQSKNLK